MKRYLMRGGISPLEIVKPDRVNRDNLIGANSGNLLYAFGVYRSLATENVTIDMDYYGVERSYTDEDIDRINEEYDAYICPLADAFRKEFTFKLVKYAYFFNRLKIPCYVIGMGLREDMTDDTEAHLFSYPFDNEAKEFIKAVRKKGTILGLRGEMTGEYFKQLGFRAEEDYSVIGCPSMYMFGRHLNMRPLPVQSGEIPADTRIAFNLSSKTPVPILEFLNGQMERFPNHSCVMQNENDLRLIYYGRNYKTRYAITDEQYPLTVENKKILEDRCRMFINVPTWISFMKQQQLSIGSKLHGNVSAILGGCPAVFFPIDGRMQELIRYHKFPYLTQEQLAECCSIEEVLERADMESYIKAHPANFDRFVDFLDRNQLEHIYSEDRERKEAPVDEKMKILEYPQVTSIMTCDRKETLRRFNELNDAKSKKASEAKKKQENAGEKPAAAYPRKKEISSYSLKEIFSFFCVYLRQRTHKKKQKNK